MFEWPRTLARSHFPCVGRPAEEVRPRSCAWGLANRSPKARFIEVREVITMAFEGFPFVVGWELTLACNLRCRHCASTAGLARENELSLDECLALCDQFPALLVQEVDFTGGEPLLHPGWERIAARLRELGITTRMITNGIGLTPDTVRRMKQVNFETRNNSEPRLIPPSRFGSRVSDFHP